MTALSSVAVAPGGEARAVETPLAATGSGVILHWTKRAWVTAAAPVTGGSVLPDGMTAVSPGNVWAVGTASAHGGAYLPYEPHWNGRRWASVAVPHPGEGSENEGFEAVRRTGHGDLLAVGSAASATVGRALYRTWNGLSLVSWSAAANCLSVLAPVTDEHAGAMVSRQALSELAEEITRTAPHAPPATPARHHARPAPGGDIRCP